ncbi:MAG: CPBP family intramembrane metalloprotease [candidate division KSB1 bacterium]|nr:CPBP family intramembrane metalloprotease [candidate division KSB1 bacterium]
MSGAALVRRFPPLRRYLEATASSRFAACTGAILLAIYELSAYAGAESAPRVRNAVDVWLRRALPQGGELVAPLAAAGILAVVFARRRGRRYRFRAWWIPAFAGESAGWALLSLLAMRMLKFVEVGAMGAGRMVGLAAGAGVFEEVLFRWIFAGGISYILCRAGVHEALAVAIALGTSALAFAAAHVFGGMAQPLGGAGIVRLSILGLILGALYFGRGLATAMSSHALYDLMVMVVTA